MITNTLHRQRTCLQLCCMSQSLYHRAMGVCVTEQSPVRHWVHLYIHIPHTISKFSLHHYFISTLRSTHRSILHHSVYDAAALLIPNQ